MKKVIVLFVITILVVMSVVFVGCNNNVEGNEGQFTQATYTVMTPDGAPSMAIAKMMMDNNQFGGKANYSIIGSEAVASSMTNGDADFIIAPTNAGVMLAAKLGTYKMVAVTSWGNLYVVGKNTYKSLQECDTTEEFMAQFSGKSVASIGTGMVPDKTFSHLLATSKIDATMTASNADLIRSDLVEGKIEFGILGEPAVTATLMNATNAKRLCSVSELWQKVTGGAFTQAGLFVKTSVIQNDPEAVKNFVNELKQSIAYLNESAEHAKELGDYMASTGKSTLKGAVVSKCYLQMSQKFEFASLKASEIFEFVRVLGVNVPENADVFYSTETSLE